MNIFKKTDTLFFEKHPELKGRKLTMDPADYKYRAEYMKILKNEKKSLSNTSANLKEVKPKCSKSSAAKDKKKANSTKCSAQSLSISKEKGEYTLKIPGTKVDYKNTQYEDLRILEIVSGGKNKPTSISVITDGLVGPCSETHKDQAFQIVKHNFISPVITDGKLSAKISFWEIPNNNSFAAYAEIIRLITGKNNLDYTIDYNLCGFTEQAIIRVYPDISAKASIEMEHKLTLSKKGNDLEKDGGIKDALKYDFEVSYAHQNLISFNKESKEDEEECSIVKFLTVFSDSYKYLQKGFSVFLSDSQKLELSFAPKLETTFALKEVKGKPFVDAEYEVNIGFDPLFSLNGEADVSGALLTAVPVLGAFISALESVDVAEVFLGFKTDVKISLSGSFSKPAGEDWDDPTLKFNSSGKIKLEGKVASNAQIWRIKYSTGFKIGAESGFEIKDCKLTSDEKGIFFPLKLDFLGIIVYSQSWLSIGIADQKSTIPKAAGTAEIKAIGTEEAKEVDNLDDADKETVVEPREGLWNHNFYLN